jgi:hypothetical protein
MLETCYERSLCVVATIRVPKRMFKAMPPLFDIIAGQHDIVQNYKYEIHH